MALQPPTIEELQKTVGNIFDAKWIKYIYAHFKNECPSGKMRLSAFKNLFYPHLPEGVSDEYIRRLFFAFSFGECEVTFETLLETLAMLKTSSALTNAKWTMRLISGSETKPVSYEDFENFVKSIFVRNNNNSHNIGSKALSVGFEDGLNLDKIVEKRAKNRFAILDRNDDGLIEVDELVEFFEGDGGANVERLIGSGKGVRS